MSPFSMSTMVMMTHYLAFLVVAGRAEMIGVKELNCIKCNTPRKVKLGESDDNTTGSNGTWKDKSHGIAWLLDQANDLLPRLSKQSEEQPPDFSALILGGGLFSPFLSRRPIILILIL